MTLSGAVRDGVSDASQDGTPPLLVDITERRAGETRRSNTSVQRLDGSIQLAHHCSEVNDTLGVTLPGRAT